MEKQDLSAEDTVGVPDMGVVVVDGAELGSIRVVHVIYSLVVDYHRKSCRPRRG